MRNLTKLSLSALMMSQVAFGSFAQATHMPAPIEAAVQTSYKTMKIEGLDIFYREAGSPKNPTLLLLHGFPTSSHMFRNLIPQLSEKYHVIAPDYPGYGNSSMPSVDKFDYTFDHMASIVETLLKKKSISKYSVYVMDYGAPIGFRIASANPEQIESLIIQNGNAYEEGLDNNFWQPIKAYWKDRKAVNKGLDNPWWKNVKAAYKQPNMTNDDALRFLLTKGATTWQYTNGVRDVSKISLDAINEDQRLLDREGNQEIQLQMFYDYGSNPALYPKWQAYFREHQPATLIVWGDKDEIFPSAGAFPYKKDLKNLEFHLLDTGHFALEEDGNQIAQYIETFLDKNVSR
ncbi:alpha/beta fold hydrolase [Pseudoalteromonas denitrificans]|uniref:Pimeloyl-ACP methyl ester carboxylesterase n=1 Tax=Pseudoalteromonas denitrificans DSM 6059 TaxID=1123010 RepID=A0A1I1MRI9_9GAMM|nr:alpha/beta hydrolase [Pseudoalteromonas denitrificans]SFC87979.1 Pimeloyl-ACP methyl ester carboxylesterase [Pseudoalteromonas denitrificans DSM 6059]